MSCAEEVKFSLKVMMNKDKTKVLFAEADRHFTDILLSLLTLPLGRILKVLENHYGDETPIIGSINTLYRSLANLDSDHFWTEGAKLSLLHPESPCEDFYRRLKLNITGSQPAEYFVCGNITICSYRLRSESVYYDETRQCPNCHDYGCMEKEVSEEFEAAAANDYGVFTQSNTAFIISDDLSISASATGLLQTISMLGITDMDSAKLLNVSFGLSEIMNLLKASFTSQTPLSDLILNNCTRKTNAEGSTPEIVTSSHQVGDQKTSKSKKIFLKLTVQKSTGKLLFAQAEENFVELLFSFLVIPVGRVECLLAGKTCIKSIDNLYRSVVDVLDEKYFKIGKSNLIEPCLAHGYVSEHHVFPLAEAGLSYYYHSQQFSSTKFPKGQGSYLNGPTTYHVTDDLTLTPFCVTSVVSLLRELKIAISDLKEVEVQIGLAEALNILKASLTSTSALSSGLQNHIYAGIQPKPELF